MPVNTPQTEITPYTSTVPLVQIPPDVIESQTRPPAPLQGQFGGHKGSPGLAIGDSLLKGFMLGHQQKEQRKQQQAQATINAADAASNAAYDQYQEALTKAGGKQDDPAAQAAYQSYVQTFQAGKQAKAQFVIPEKTQKGKKAAADSGGSAGAGGTGGKEKKPPSAGFNNIKDFFEANPHIVPQIALLTMQPKPPGLSPQGQEQVQNLETNRLANETKQRQLANEKTYQDGFATFAHLSPGDIAALPPDAKKNYEKWVNARAAITPLKFTGTAKLYDVGNGKKAYLYPEEAAQYYPDAQPVDTSAPKPGTPGFFLKKKADELKKDVNDLTTEEIEAANGEYRASLTPSTSTTSTSTTDPQGDRTTTTTRKATPGGIQRPPTASQQASPAAGGITKPPTAAAAPSGQRARGVTPPPQASKTAKSGITPPPGGKQTATTAAVTRQATKDKETAYATARINRDKARQLADRQYEADAVKYSPEVAEKLRKGAYDAADDEYNAKTSEADKTFQAAVKSIGGNMGGGGQNGELIPPPGATLTYKDANGTVQGWAVNGVFVPVGK